MSYVIEITNGICQGKKYQLLLGSNLLGRFDIQDGVFPEVDLDPADEEAKISRRHCFVMLGEDGNISIQDAGSLNGTYVKRLGKLKPFEFYALNCGDEILIGSLSLKVVSEAD